MAMSENVRFEENDRFEWRKSAIQHPGRREKLARKTPDHFARAGDGADEIEKCENFSTSIHCETGSAAGRTGDGDPGPEWGKESGPRRDAIRRLTEAFPVADAGGHSPCGRRCS
ncbi:hypothetical protein ZHAS_00015393 [Anopheles sinensis]|uniref:Uncharacterized protein n=1 Tax=Anopheles sinensis TaxID=74873 RepID=A0A084WAU1_ANOSI|nr:hypothetical protein ZHAS_00015393 [Anopheles sinensis]